MDDLTFSSKIEKNKGDRDFKVPIKKHKRNWEGVAVVHLLFYSVAAAKGVLECLSANLALQKFMPSIFASLEQLNVCSQSLRSVSFRNVR